VDKQLDFLPKKPGQYVYIWYSECGCCVDKCGAFYIMPYNEIYPDGPRQTTINGMSYHWEAGDIPSFFEGVPQMSAWNEVTGKWCFYDAKQ
jgi:hypothetical protein